MNLLDDLRGARIVRIDAPFPDVLTLTLSRPSQRETLVIGFGSNARGAGLVLERPRGAPADDFVRRLRKEIESAVLVSVERLGAHALRAFATRGGVERCLVVELARSTENVLLLDEHQHVLFAHDHQQLLARGLKRGEPWWLAVAHDQDATPISLEELRDAGERLLAKLGRENIEQERLALMRAVRLERRKLERRLIAIDEDLSRASEANEHRKEASFILANLHAIRADDTEIRAVDWTESPPQERVVSIDPRLGPKAQSEKLFRIARRLSRGIPIATERKRETSEKRGMLLALEERITNALTNEQIRTLGDEAERIGLRRAQQAPSKTVRTKRSKAPERVPFRSFVSTTGRTILVGRSARDNDALVLHHARPSDLWLHARGCSGAHVIVPLEREETCPPEVLLDAATLAAHFSDERSEPIVDVQYTPRRYVRKAKGSAQGAVTLDRERVLALRVEPARLKRLLNTER